MESPEAAYTEAFNAWNSGNYACALELSRVLTQRFPDGCHVWLLRGIVLYEVCRYAEAEQALTKSIQSFSPEHLDYGYTQLANLYLQKGEHELAEKWYRRAIEVNPEDAGRHSLLGCLLAKRGDLKGAEAAHRQATRCTKGDLDEAFLNLGLVLRSQERYGEALKCFEKALELTPDDDEAQKAAADVRLVLEHTPESS